MPITPTPTRFFRIAFTLAAESPARVTYVRAPDEEMARHKVYDRFADEPVHPHIIWVEAAEGEFITD